MEYSSVWGKNSHGRFGVFELVTILLLAMVLLPFGCAITPEDDLTAAEDVKVENVVQGPILFYGFDLSKGSVTTERLKIRSLFRQNALGYPVFNWGTVKVVYDGDDGIVYYYKRYDEFYVQQDSRDLVTQNFYGPFKGYPFDVIKDLPKGKGRINYHDLVLAEGCLEKLREGGARKFDKKTDLTDVFEERPKGSGKYPYRKEVEVMGDFFYVPSKNISYHIQNKVRGFGKPGYFGPLPGKPSDIIAKGSKRNQLSIGVKLLLINPAVIRDIGQVVVIPNPDYIVGSGRVIKKFDSSDGVRGGVGIGKDVLTKYQRKMLFSDFKAGIGIYYLSDIEVEKVIGFANSDSESRLLTASKILIADGGSGAIPMSKEVKYVLGFKESPGAQDDSPGEITGSFNEGFELRLTPFVDKYSRSIDAAINFEKKDLLVLQQHLEDSGKNIDIPVWLHDTLTTRLDVPVGKTLMISGITASNTFLGDEKNKKVEDLNSMHIVMLITAEITRGDGK